MSIVLRIAQAQINPTVGALQANANLITHFLKQARQIGADLVTFPELAISGCPLEDLLLVHHFLNDCSNILYKLAVRQCKDINAIIGCPLAEDNLFYNCAAILGQGKILGIYRKIELLYNNFFNEKRYFSPGHHSLFLDIKGIRLAITIGEDILIEGGLAESLIQKNGVQAVINISSFPFYIGNFNLRYDNLKKFARRCKVYLIHNNLLGGQDELVFDGGSLVIDKKGKILAFSKRFEENFLVFDLTFEIMKLYSVPGPSNSLLILNHCNRLSISNDIKRLDRLPSITIVDEVYQTLILGLQDYVHKNRFKKVVLGLSGGIDSSLVATIAVEALGINNIIGVTMSSQFTSIDTYRDIKQLVKNLGIRLMNVPIDNIVQIYINDLTKYLGSITYTLVHENLQARIRANILMSLSNYFGWLVLTTGNKSEIAVGYCTIYGDMAGGFAVVKDIPKTMIYKLAAFANQKAKYDLIPQNIFTKSPSAELRPNQKDEDVLPPYAILDPILNAYIEQNLAADEIIALGFNPVVVYEVLRLVNLNEYKRRQSPLGIKITPKFFGYNRIFPVTNHYQGGYNSK